MKIALVVMVAFAVCVAIFLRPEDYSLAGKAPKGVPIVATGEF